MTSLRILNPFSVLPCWGSVRVVAEAAATSSAVFEPEGPDIPSSKGQGKGNRLNSPTTS